MRALRCCSDLLVDLASRHAPELGFDYFFASLNRLLFVVVVGPQLEKRDSVGSCLGRRALSADRVV